MKRLLVITETEGEFIGFGYVQVPDDAEVTTFDWCYFPKTTGNGIRKLANLSDEEVAAYEKKTADALAATS